MSQDVSVSDDCNLTNVKLYLNSELYPYDNLNVDFGKNRYVILFDMYARKAYYGYNCYETLHTVVTFLTNGPFVIIDAQQNESIENTVDVRIEFDCKENVSANTIATIVSSYMIVWLNTVRYPT